MLTASSLGLALIMSENSRGSVVDRADSWHESRRGHEHVPYHASHFCSDNINPVLARTNVIVYDPHSIVPKRLHPSAPDVDHTQMHPKFWGRSQSYGASSQDCLPETVESAPVRAQDDLPAFPCDEIEESDLRHIGAVQAR